MFFIQIKAFFFSFFAPPFWGRIFLLFPFLCFSHLILAQTPLSNERVLTVSNPSEILVQDTLTIVPNSVQILDSQSNTYLDSTYFSVKNNLIVLNKEPCLADSLRIDKLVRNYLDRQYKWVLNALQTHHHLLDTITEELVNNILIILLCMT